MRVHLVGLPHRDPVKDWEPCAYSGKLLRLCDMLTGQGHDVILYAGPGCDAEVAEHVVVVSDDDRARWGYDVIDWRHTVFNQFDPTAAPWVTMNSRAVQAMAERVGPTDIIGLTMGTSQAAIRAAFPQHVVAEVGVGYEGVLDSTHRCFESEAWRHYIYGRKGVVDGRFFDVVIPNAFDPDDYDFRADKDDYLLFLGRMIPRKGLAVVAELAKHHRVVTAGQGDERVPGAEHLGVVTGDDKRKLLAGAWALLCPTQYIEPFGGVAVEAMLSGTPVITTPWGAFSETVAHGYSGWRCHTLTDFLAAADQAHTVDHHSIRAWAKQFSIAHVALRYDAWLRRLGTLYSEGWYEC